MLTLFFILYFPILVLWLVLYPIVMTLKGRDPFHDHPFPRWRYLEHQAQCAAGACTAGLPLYLAFHSYIPQVPLEFLKIHLTAVIGFAFLSWMKTRGSFALIPNPLDLPAYIRYRIGKPAEPRN